MACLFASTGSVPIWWGFAVRNCFFCRSSGTILGEGPLAVALEVMSGEFTSVTSKKFAPFSFVPLGLRLHD